MSSSNFRPIGSTTREGHDAGLVQYRVPAGEGLSKGIALARKIAANASMTAFAVMQALPRIAERALPRIAEQAPGAGLFTEAPMAAWCCALPSRCAGFLIV